MARVFVSHASADAGLAGELHGWLTADGHQVFLDQDLRDGIALGEEWQQRLHERLRWADAVVCVLTSAYRDSTWCAAEVGIAQAHGSRLLPLLAESGAEHPLLPPGRYQVALLVNDPVAARSALGEALRRVDAAGGLGWPEDRSPFPGLRPFEPDLHRVFFGRHAEVAALADLLRSPAAAADAATVLVVGPSGCGKSSLVRGGLLPVMASEPGWETLPAMVPGADPIGGLARAVAVAAQRLELGWTFREVREQLGHPDGLAVLAEELVVAGGGRTRHLLVVDQFEELLTLTSPAASERFAGLLRTALATSLQVVATLRADFLGPLLANGQLAELPARSFMLRPLARSALPAVIEEPARLAGIGVDDELVSRLVADTNTGDALPLLAFTLAQLADGVPRGGRLSAARYDQLGGVRGALIGQADAALADALAASGRARDQVIAGLLRLVTVDEQGRPIRSQADWDELPGPVRVELDAFVARRLLTTDTDDDGRVVLGVAHEAFLAGWPPLAAAITTATSALRTRRVVEQAAADWDDAGRPPDQLWERGQLAAVVAGTGARIQPTSPSQLVPLAEPQPKWLSPAFLNLRRKRVLVTDQVELSSRARDFLFRSIRRDRSRRRRATTVLSVLLVLAVTAAGIAVVQRQKAQENLQIATARQLISEAQAVVDADPQTALQLGLAAWRINSVPETRASLVTSLLSTRYAATRTGHGRLVDAVAVSWHRKLLATGSTDRTVQLWSLADLIPTPIGPPITAHDLVVSAAFSPNGQILAIGGAHQTVRLLNVADPAHPLPVGPVIEGHDASDVKLTGCSGGCPVPVLPVAFSPDGDLMATGGVDKTVRFWSLDNPDNPIHVTPVGQVLKGHTGWVRSLAFSKDGKVLYTGSVDQTVRLWSLANSSRPIAIEPALPAHEGEVRSVAISPNGKILVTTSGDRSARLWSIADPTKPTPIGEPLKGHQDNVTSAAFSPDGRTLVTGSDDHTVRRWDVATPNRPVLVEPVLTGPRDEVWALAFSGDGHALSAGIANGTLVVWNLTEGTVPDPLGPPLKGHEEGAGVDPVTFSADGALLASASEDETVRPWNVANPRVPVRLDPIVHEVEVASAAFSPKQRILATGDEEGQVRVWDLSAERSPRLLASFGNESEEDADVAVASVAFSPDGRFLASASEDETIQLWNIATQADPVLMASLPGHTDQVDSVAFHPDGNLLASGGSDETVRLWDASDKRHPVALGAPLEDHDGVVNSVAFSPDGRTLASASDDRRVRIWDVGKPANPTPLAQISVGSPATSVEFSPDSRILAIGSEDTTVRMWEVTDRIRPAPLGRPLKGHTEAVNSVSFNKDDSLLATSADDATVRLFDLTNLNAFLDDPVTHACSRTPGFNEQEWRRHIRGLPYQNTCPG